jgi:hypothetical protein
MSRGAGVALDANMKPYLFVIGMSRSVYPMLGMRSANCHLESATALSPRPPQKFDYSPQELSTILEWVALERKAA